MSIKEFFFGANTKQTAEDQRRINDTAHKAWEADKLFRQKHMKVCKNCLYYRPKGYKYTTGNCHGLPAQVVVRAGRSDSTNGTYDSVYPQTTEGHTCTLFTKKE